MRKICTVANNRVEILKDDRLTIGVDLGDRFSHYCILNAAGEVIFKSQAVWRRHSVNSIRAPL